MGYLTFFINRVALETQTAMDSYNSEDHAGTSYLPFIGFMLFLAGIVVIIVGLATYLTAKHNFNIFFDARDVRMMPCHIKPTFILMKNLLKIRKRER